MNAMMSLEPAVERPISTSGKGRREMLVDEVRKIIKERSPKEYACHLQFVHELAVTLQREYGGNDLVIQTAALIHDYARQEGKDNSRHPEEGAIEVVPVLERLGYTPNDIAMVSRCVLMHDKTKGFESLEEEIVANADQLSKLTHHAAFVLMSKKDTWREKTEWALKYLDKGYNNLTLGGLKERYRDAYLTQREIYLQALRQA